MMNMETALEDKMDLIIKTLKEFKEEGTIVDDQQLVVLLAKTYEKILPPMAKMFVRPDAFVNACLKKKPYILKMINKEQLMSRFKIV